MRVRFVMASDRESGAAKPMVELAVGLAGRGHAVHFSCKKVREWSRKPLDEYIAGFAGSGLTVDTDLALNNRTNPLDLWRDARLLASQLRRDGTEVLLCSYRTDHWVAVLAARMAGTGVRVIRFRHHSKPERADPLHRWCYRQTSHVVEICQRTAERDARRLGLGPERVSVLYGHVDVERVHPGLPAADLRAEWGLPRESVLVGYPARLVPKRRPDLLMAAAREIIDADPRVHLVLLGRGPLEPLIERERVRRGLWGNVHIGGYRTDFLNAVRALDAVVFLREGTDGGCRALLESMALGRPCIVWDEGPLPEIVGPAGRVVGSVGELARAVLDYGALTASGPLMRERALDFTFERRLDAVEGLLR